MKDVDLNSKSLADLKYIAQLMGFSNYAKLKKKELIDLISGAENIDGSLLDAEKRKDILPETSEEHANNASDKSSQSDDINNSGDKPPRKRGRKRNILEESAPDVFDETDITSDPSSDEAITLPGTENINIEKSDDNLNGDTSPALQKPANKSGRRRGRPSKKSTAPGEDTQQTAETESETKEKDTIQAENTENIETKNDTESNVSPETSSEEDKNSDTFVIKTGSRKNKKQKNDSEKVSEQEPDEVKEEQPQEEPETYDIFEGMLDVLADGYGFLRSAGYLSGSKDVYVAPMIIKKYLLKTGDKVLGKCKMQKDNEKFQALFEVLSINGYDPEVAMQRKPFDTLIPIYPDEKLKLEVSPTELSTRLIDLISPIGKGQRGIIVSPPKAGKTVLLKKIANSITTNYPEIELIVLLIDERPEEVTDMRESIKGDVVSSTFDEVPERHIKVAEMVIERAQRLVEHGRDVVILLDSMTRLARAYNLTIPPTGRTLSGGLDPGALHKPKRFFGSARNIRNGGSLTIVSTALIDTGSKMDEVIYEEFKGTGNMELHLDRKLSEKRIFPAIDINKSGTRKEELLLSVTEINSMWAVRKAMTNLGTADVTEMIVTKLLQTKTNEDFVRTINTSFGGKK